MHTRPVSSFRAGLAAAGLCALAAIDPRRAHVSVLPVMVQDTAAEGLEEPPAAPSAAETVSATSPVFIAKGDTMLCAVLVDGKPTAQRVLVTVLEVKRHWQTQEPLSVRVKTCQQPTRFIWVQAQYLTPAVPQYVA